MRIVASTMTGSGTSQKVFHEIIIQSLKNSNKHLLWELEQKTHTHQQEKQRNLINITRDDIKSITLASNIQRLTNFSKTHPVTSLLSRTQQQFSHDWYEIQKKDE